MWEQCISHEIVTLCSDCVIFRESARDKQESRVTMQMELQARHREERELEERRLEREHFRHVELLEREHKRHVELVALFTRGSTPQPPQVNITQPRSLGKTCFCDALHCHWASTTSASTHGVHSPLLS